MSKNSQKQCICLLWGEAVLWEGVYGLSLTIGVRRVLTYLWGEALTWKWVGESILLTCEGLVVISTGVPTRWLSYAIY